jgi:hypothetical protein
MSIFCFTWNNLVDFILKSIFIKLNLALILLLPYSIH